MVRALVPSLYTAQAVMKLIRAGFLIKTIPQWSICAFWLRESSNEHLHDVEGLK